MMTPRLGVAVLLLPTARDVALAQEVLARHGLPSKPCPHAAELETCLDEAGVVVVSEEWLAHGAQERLVQALARQPRWSDLPIVVVARAGADSAQASDALAALGNVTLLERPLRMTALVSAVRAGLRARGRQLELREHLEALQTSGELLADAARRKDALLAMLAHELRNPLAPVRNALHVLRHAPLDTASAQDLYATMERQVDHLVRLVDDLVVMARVTHDKIDLDRRPVAVRDVIDDAVAMVRDAAEQAGHVLDLPDPPSPLWLCGDRERLVQALCNVLLNAVRYTPPGGHIQVSADADGPDVAIGVRDSGVGIPADLLPHVFELFSQGERAQRRVRDGLGIGLALVRQLVELHGGSVRVASEGAGRGALFILSLPRHDPPAVLDAAPAATLTALPSRTPESVNASGLRVLVVDDNADAAQALGLLVDMLGHRACVQTSGAAALAAAVEQPFDAALLDLGMPGMDGYDLARRLRALPSAPPLAIAAVTGWDRAGDRERTREAGFDAHFAKPVDADTVLGFLDRARPATASAA